MKKFYSCANAAISSGGQGATVVHGNLGRRGRVGGGAVATCCAFLRDWVDTLCQIDGGGRVLWPQGMTVKDVFSTTFQAWLAEQGAPSSTTSPTVSLSSFRRQLLRKQKQPSLGILLRAGPPWVTLFRLTALFHCPVGHTHTGVDAEHRQHNRVIVFASCIVYFAISVSRA